MSTVRELSGLPADGTVAAPSSTEEVRVAIALNGGVSLAVWMGGCAVELDAARRAHLGPEDLRVAAELTDDAAPSPPPGRERAIYHALCSAFDRELVVDLMSGSSAGGINGALLAAAIHGRRRLHPDFIRDKWLQLGDFETLLHPLRAPSPTSLMGGHAFFVKLRRTFEELLPTRKIAAEAEELTDTGRQDWEQGQEQLDLPRNHRERDADLATDVKLEITATDVIGEERRFRDTWGEELVATEYRQRFRFRRPGDYTAQRLAMAARASASFPLAFEPWAVDGGMLDVAGRRWLIDGGLLDNAPIRAVLDLIPARASERPVRRFVCYLNADPPLTPTFDPDAEVNDVNRQPAAGATAKKSKGADETAARPQLQDVVAYMVSLPRKASFVDQLRAIQQAVSRSTTVESSELPLLALDEDCLAATASALLPAYRSRRRLASLQEILEQPADVSRVAERLSRSGEELPWIPNDLGIALGDSDDDGAAPGRAWGWGVRAAERVLYLQLDLLRPRLARAARGDDAATHEALLQARKDIYAGLATLADIHANLTGDPQLTALATALTHSDEPAVPSILCALGCLMDDPARDPAIRDVVECAARSMFDVRSALGHAGENPLASALFGPGADAPGMSFRPAHFRAFLRRTLQMEVVRRAFSAHELVDSEQPLLFAQLTPCVPTLIYAPWPLHPGDEVPRRPDDKLTGTRWGHFAAFYRASWRANDFMWGRLDAAARIVDMLLPPERTSDVDDADAGAAAGAPGRAAQATAAAGVLANALLPAEAFGHEPVGEERRWLVAEALTDALPVPEREQDREHEYRSSRREELASAGRDALLPTLTACIAEDLDRGVDGHPRQAVTRALCARAAQWEVLRCELPRVIAMSEQDRGLGTAIRALDVIPARGSSWRQGIEALRREKTPLPERLGVDDKAEQASPLMLRTASHAALIGLSALRGSGLPGSPAFVLPRTLLLPIAGMVARRWWPYPFAVALAFWSFALFVTARLITLEPGAGTPWDTGRWIAVATTWLAAAGVLMICLLPFWRFVRGRSWKSRLPEAIWLVLLAASGGGIALALHLLDRVALIDLVAQTGSERPWDVVAGAALVVLCVFRFVPRFVPGRVQRWAASSLDSAWKGPLSLAIFLAPWMVLGAWAMVEVVWETAWAGASTAQDAWLARAAIVLPALVAFCYALFSVQRVTGAGRRRRSAR